jgi:hypothetical protein
VVVGSWEWGLQMGLGAQHVLAVWQKFRLKWVLSNVVAVQCEASASLSTHGAILHKWTWNVEEAWSRSKKL